jgi:hypothetical protein
MHEFQIWLLVMTLFLPRLGLIIAWFTGQIPYNTVPFAGDVLMTIFIPRVLMLIYIATDLGTSSPWFWIHLIVAIIAWGFGFLRVVSAQSRG